MKIKKVYAERFMSFDKFEFDLENRGLLFVKGENKDTNGSNGAGKSSFVPESIVWTIFGETIRGVELKEDVINDKIPGGTMTRVDLDNDYTIIRTREHDKFGNKLMLFHKDKDLTKSKMELTQKDINTLFNVDVDIFVNSIVLSGSSNRANFLDNKNNILRRQIIETILGLDRFSLYTKVINDKIKDIEREKSGHLSMITQLGRQIANFNEKIAKSNAKKIMFEQDKANTIRWMEEEIKKLSTVDAATQLGVYSKINTGNELKAKIKGTISGLNNILRGLEQKKLELATNIGKYKNFINKACEYCGSVLDANRLNTMIKNLEQESGKLDQQITLTQNGIGNYTQNIAEINVQIKDLMPEYTEKQLLNIEVTIKMMKENLVKEQGTVFQDVDFTGDIQGFQDSINECKRQIVLLEEEFDYYKFWEVGFGNKGLKTYILDDMIQFLNRKIEFYLNILSKGSMHLMFDKYLNFDVSGLKYRNCSSGERKRVDLAVLIALYDLTNLRNKDNYNILVLDEVLDSIDEIGIEAAQELLLELNKRIPTIFVISHNDILAQYFPSTVTVVKEKGVSRIE